MNLEALIANRTMRVKTLTITPDLILEMLKIPADGVQVGDKTVRCIAGPVPQSAKALRASIDHRGDVCLLIEDASFQQIHEGDVTPTLNPVYGWEWNTRHESQHSIQDK